MRPTQGQRLWLWPWVTFPRLFQCFACDDFQRRLAAVKAHQLLNAYAAPADVGGGHASPPRASINSGTSWDSSLNSNLHYTSLALAAYHGLMLLSALILLNLSGPWWSVWPVAKVAVAPA